MATAPPSADDRWLDRAAELARRGFPAPNPHVGCVLVLNGEVVGEGWHEAAGGPHAEVVALAAAADQAAGATAYVTLEPCNHLGRTGPCSLALLEAGVRRVVYACSDPNPAARGGAETLRAGGVEVELRPNEAAREANHRWLQAIEQGRPYVVAKVAQTIDGFLALPNGESQWITGPEAREEGHRLRAECGAVLVGRATVEADDPWLTARLPGVVNPPVRVVLDPSARLTRDRRVFDDAAPTVHLTSAQLSTKEGRFDPHEVLANLWDRGVRGVLVEGGAWTIRSFADADLVDEWAIFTGPAVFGHGRNGFGGPRVDRVAEGRRWRCVRAAPLGDSAVMFFRRA